MDKHSKAGQKPVRLCNYVDVYKNDRITADLDFMTATATDEQIEAFRLRVGDTVITKDSETADDIGVPAFVDCSEPDLVCGYHLSVIRPRTDRTDPRFLYWVLASLPTAEQWSLSASGVTRVGLRAGDIARVRVPRPPLPEQRAIADYLDRETAQIDALIEKQERLIATLRERADTEVANRLMTSGPTVPLKHRASVVLGKMLDAGRDVPSGATVRPYLRAGNVEEDGSLDLCDLNSMPFTQAEISKLSVRAGDVMVIEGGATAGRPAYVDHDLSDVHFQKTLNRVRPTEGLASGRFLFYVLRAAERAGEFARSDSAAMPHVTAERLNRVRIPAFDLDEQCRIVAYLDQQRVTIGQTVVAVRRLVSLSQERRAALIAAAVTGQIDVTTAA